MTTTAELANATIRVKATSDRCVGWPLAAIKAIEGMGVRDKADVKRLTKVVLRTLRSRETIPTERKRYTMLTPEQVAVDFDTWLARKRARSESFEVNFGQLSGLIDQFRTENYRTLQADTVPEVSEIEAAIRSRWALKAAKRRRYRANIKLRKKRAAEEAARQQELPF